MKNDPVESLSNAELLSLLTRVGETHIWMHIEKLQEFDGENAFSKAQK